ncbi:hypothetical protein ACFYM0_37110 [Streptomyces sp. NPDC006487]|uniref:hypothetical protein n=1 Tax=Streptomyces sp. NPDC006487 TaxID=3364748 RepID=UPI00367ED1B4
MALVTSAPPRSAEVPCGTMGFAVRVMAQEDTDGSVIEEGAVEVLGCAAKAAGTRQNLRAVRKPSPIGKQL